MPAAMPPLTESDRRAHPRRALRHPLTLETADGDLIACESVDVSIGGMRIQSSSRVPLGSCEVIVSSDGGDVLALQGDVVEEIIDASTGTVTARIVFLPAPDAALERVIALPDLGDKPSVPAHRRGGLLLAAGLAVGLVIVAGTLVVSRDDDDRVTPAAAVASAPSTEVAPIDAQPHVPGVSPQTVEAPPVISDAPAATPAPIAPPAAESATPPTEPAPASAARVERADNTVLVELGSSAEETSVTSTMGPSPEGDVVRLQLHVTPEPDGTTLPIALTLENRGTETVTFEGGFRATVTASQDGAASAATALTSETVTEVAPGEVVTVEGVLDFGATGTYDVTAAVEVS